MADAAHGREGKGDRKGDRFRNREREREKDTERERVRGREEREEIERAGGDVGRDGARCRAEKGGGGRKEQEKRGEVQRRHSNCSHEEFTRLAETSLAQNTLNN